MMASRRLEPGRLLLALLVAAVMGGCRSQQESGPEGSGTLLPELLETADPALAQTLQADVAATAAWVAELTPLSPPTVGPQTTLVYGEETGTPLLARRGDCPLPEGFTLHLREGFCLSAPEDWRAYNMDGGVAASLETTPGQAISLVPGWAGSSDVCNLMIYVTSDSSALDHLGVRHDRFESQPGLTALSDIQVQSLGELAIPGFTWSTQDGVSGGVYADTIGVNRLAHIAFSGLRCTAADLLLVLDTLRFNVQ